MDNVLTVTQVNTYIRHLMDADEILRNVWIRGEISNFKLHYSGHMYMSLKDEGSSIRAVMFKGNNQRLRFTLENGMSVIAAGRISVYERDGQYQLYIEEMLPEGTGDLYIAYEQLKKKLAAEGLFDEDKKKPIPKYPARIGVVTSGTGAAVRDILNVLKRRYPVADICIYPVLVQGEGASAEIEAALRFFSRSKNVDVVIVGRGGGSIEDLWAFNEERTVRAVSECEIPVISAVGHETDFTLCDFAADLRAPTPSAAAELAVPDISEVAAYIEHSRAMLSRALINIIEKGEQRQKIAEAKLSPDILLARIDDGYLRLDTFFGRLEASLSKAVAEAEKRMAVAASSLDALSPLKVLARGYSVAEKEDGEIIKSIGDVSVGEKIAVILSDGAIGCEVKGMRERGNNGKKL